MRPMLLIAGMARSYSQVLDSSNRTGAPAPAT